MKSFLTAVCAFLAFSLSGQQAPDFTVTDIHGVEHKLYEDYLNQGKSVLIKIMFTTCPPCNAIAPLMEPFYQEWGAGEYDVEFFEMTDKNFDTNALMEAYANQYNETFPAISIEGNALATVQPYKNGNFGPWSGTPTFIVIAPDGSVQFDISGGGNQATIDAIDAALSATGALKPGQTSNLAPDFTITDSHGKTHSLYADYLNQGKTVLIEVFYTTCPPCNSIAPLMEPLYQEWGGGDYDVEFFELSDKNFDTDELVNAYQATYGETFIAAGVEGGSLAAVAPYKSGEYGPWLGTPTFIVIAPDGTFRYDVDGGNNESTIDSLEAAIAATGALKPNIEQPVSVSGAVHFLSGTAGVGNAEVQIVNSLGNVVHSTTTNASGEFDLQLLLSEVQPGWEMKVVKTGDPLNGVNALDLVRIQKHILFSEPFTDPLPRLAADANKSNSISGLDNVTILKLLLGISTNFSDGQSWIVLPADTDFGPPVQQPPVITSTTIPLQAILDGTRQPDWIAIKKGDVNGNANPNE